MKNYYSTLILLLIFSFSAIAQKKSNYERGFEIGFKEGYCYDKTTYNCLTPMTPLTPIPRINESSENYTEGYNRGFQYGLDLKRSKDALKEVDINLNRRLIKFNEYISQNPVNAMVSVGMMMQEKYDARKDWIQGRIYSLGELLTTLFNKETLPSYISTEDTREQIWKNVVKYTNSIRGYDFADEYQYSSIKTNFNKIESNFYETYNNIVSQIKQNTEKETIAVSNSDSNYADNQINENTSFSGALKKYYGKYSCTIIEYELVGNKYILKGTKDGRIELNSNIINYSYENFNGYRKLLSEVLNNNTKECTYKTEYGNIVIDYEFKKTTFYNLDNKNYYVYIIKNKI